MIAAAAERPVQVVGEDHARGVRVVARAQEATVAKVTRALPLRAPRPSRLPRTMHTALAWSDPLSATVFLQFSSATPHGFRSRYIENVDGGCMNSKTCLMSLFFAGSAGEVSPRGSDVTQT